MREAGDANTEDKIKDGLEERGSEGRHGGGNEAEHKRHADVEEDEERQRE